SASFAPRLITRPSASPKNSLAGKLQLREDEARRLNAVLLDAAEHDSAALGLLVQLVMGMRSGEVLGLRVRDLDADSTVIVIEDGKTQNARRRLEILSAPLRQLLQRQCAGLAPDALIFGNGRSQQKFSSMAF